MIRTMIAMLIVVGGSASPLLARANSLSYGFVEALRDGGEAHINYRGPDGERDVRCDVVTLSCRSFDPATEPFRITDRLSSLPITTSPDATSAVLKLTTAQGTAYAYIDLQSGLKLTLIPLAEPGNVVRVLYSRDGDTAVFVGRNMLQVYENGRVRSHAVVVPSSFTLVSPSGDYISWYNYTSKEHMIVDLSSGEFIAIDSETPAYLEISENGDFGVFKEVVRNEDALRIVTLPQSEVSTAAHMGPMIDDYLVHKNVAYFTANDIGSALEWFLFAYDPEDGEPQEIDSNISYGDYMKSVGDTLLYYKVNGDHGEVYAYKSGSIKRVPGQSASSYDPVNVRKEMEMGDVHGALLDDDADSEEEKPLIIWLHGGPQRQTSVGFHPYLSYGVYDEMLERFVRDGARVAKLDYTGSTGYGARFQKGLTKKIGVADVSDVKEAIEDLTEQYETDEVFIIGNSYGGYLALKTLVEHPDLIDGAASIAGVSDWDELIGTNSKSIFAPYFGGIPSSKTRRYYRAAEIMDNLDEIPDDTPIVIAYGEKDTTVPPSQSKIFIAGAENDKNLTKLVFPDEDHIPRARATLDRLCDGIADAFGLDDDVCSE